MKWRGQEPIQRFETNYIPEPNSGCWIWLACVSKNGYGSFMGGYAHRFSYQTFIGMIPKGMDVCHLCHNKTCVNPAHLVVGTRKENVQQSKLAGRLKFPIRKRKFSRVQLEHVVKDPRTVMEIARAYGISYCYVSNLKHGRVKITG